VFVAFTGEEAGRLGSRHYLENATRYPVDGIIAMVNLDTVGRLGERPLLALGSASAAEWVHILQGAGYVTGVAVKPVAADIGSSDQSSFIEAGVPAVQLFSGAHADYHRPGDTRDKIDAAGLVKTARVLQEIAGYLAARPEALTSGPDGARGTETALHASGKRRVSLGFVPDYAGSGVGVRIAEVRPGTPAEEAGLRAGDIIRSLNATPLQDLRDYSRALRELAPGDAVEIQFTRGTVEHRATARVSGRQGERP